MVRLGLRCLGLSHCLVPGTEGDSAGASELELNPGETLVGSGQSVAGRMTNHAWPPGGKLGLD